MKLVKLIALCIVVYGAFIVCGCASKTTLVDFSNVPDTHHCQFMKEICKEAEEFQGQYQTMNNEEKQDAKTILNAYVQQCADAQTMCQKSASQQQ